MDKETRNAIERATQRARKLLEEDFAAQLEGEFDVDRSGAIAAKGGAHLSAQQAFQRERIVAAIEHKRAAGMSASEAVNDYLRDAAFTTLNRFVALKMLEARELVQECITKGEQSSGYHEFCGLAPGLPLLKDSAGYHLYIECLFDELSTEVKVLFDRRDPSSVLWPKRATFEQLLEILNATELAGVWREDVTIGWVYQYFNGQDERRKMREESQAPRNSRELAVRNQFFTPRYVVQFLTDNTLGRIWYEMRETKTLLAHRCEYMVRKPDEQFVPRAKKDPRDLRVLDPACGSGHFLLYAFDLLLAIYEEAFVDPESPMSEATGRTLAKDYDSNIDALRAAIPGLILAHNLYGVDIDPRCAQIAQLALWMRAQRAYRDFGAARSDRPMIRRSNIVVAEPLVADEQLVNEFVSRLGDTQLARVFLELVEALKLAGDLGLLLRIETLIAQPLKHGQTSELFAPPEARIRATLAQFVAQKENRANTRKRLFADDTAQGMGLLTTSEKKFDVVLMNPPFGDGSLRGKAVFDELYPRSKNDLLSAFVERGIEFLIPRGRLGAITSRTGFFLASFEKWREDLLAHAPPVVFADLGIGVMDAALVEAAAYCLERGDASSSQSTLFLRVLEELDDKMSALLRAIHSPGQPGTQQRYEVRVASFKGVSRSPFAYWGSDALRAVFAREQPFETATRFARQGVATGDDLRFVRAWWGVPVGRFGKRWLPFAKGGKYSPFYSDVFLCVNWEHDGAELLAFTGSVVRNPDFYLRSGLTWSRRTKSQLSCRALPAGCVFADKGPAAFVEHDESSSLFALLAITSSQAFRALVEFQLAAADAKAGGAARSYEVGVIQRTPVPRLESNTRDELARFARAIWSLRHRFDTEDELSHAFVLPAAFGDRQHGTSRSESERELALQRQIDDLVFALYDITNDDRATIRASFQGTNLQASAGAESDSNSSDDAEDEVEPLVPLLAKISWLIGVAFGRFDPRLATGERPIPPDLEPFDPLPSRSPGMYPEGEEPLDRPDVLVDDDGDPWDLVRHVRIWAERVGVDVPADLQVWVRQEFFPLHIRMYSKSRRKAPIYWQLATPSARYSVWLYIHAFTTDTLFRVQNDYVAPKLAHEERRLAEMASEAHEKGTPAQRKELSAQEDFVGELRAFLEDVKRVTPMWNPNLNDGVIINFAPLWRLVPQHKSWQKELKSTWDALCDGEYDWAHLAMHLWPERVVPKCARDRSLAIAHGLEDVFWLEGSDGKWTPRKTPTRPVDELVQERTSPAVKAALKSLMEAPTVTGNGGRARGGRRRAQVAADVRGSR